MQWYYERDGQQVGPVSQTEMVRLIVHRRIFPQTLVWHPTFGDEWRPASKAGLVAPSAGVKILFSTGKRPEAGPTPSQEAGKTKISSLWAWLMLVPGVLDLVLLLAGQRSHWAITPGRPLTGICIYIILFLTIFKDRQTLARGGVKPPSFWWWLFLPGYFWCRRKVMKRGIGLFICCLFLGFLEASILLSDPPPGFEMILSQKQVEKPVATTPPPQAAPEAPQQAQPAPETEKGPADGDDGSSSDTSPSEEQVQL